MAVNAVPQEGNAAGLPDTLAPLVGGAAAGEPGGAAGVCRGRAEKQGQQKREEGNWEAALHISWTKKERKKGEDGGRGKRDANPGSFKLEIKG